MNVKWRLSGEGIDDEKGNLLRQIDPLGNETSITYTASGLPLTTTDPRGNTTTNIYDPEGNLQQVTDALNNKTTYTYDGVGRRLTQQDALDHITAYEYDANNNLVKSTNALEGITRHAYDGNNNRISTEDPSGHLTLFAYDEKDLKTSTANALGQITSYTYDALGRRVSVTDAKGHVTQFAYDGAGNLLETSDALGHKTAYTYDLNGNRLTSTDANGHQQQIRYDALNRVVGTTDALGYTTSTEYDAVGNKVSQTDRNNHTTAFVYDANNRLIQTTDAAGGMVRYAYDENGNQISVTDPLNLTATASYDANNQKISTTDPLGNTSTTSYDAVGRVNSTTDAKGRVTSFEYDALNRLLKVTDAAGGIVTYSYDANGNRTAMVDPNSHTTNYEYDALNRKTKTTEHLGHVTSLAYDAVGNITQKTDAKGQVIQYGYDDTDRLITKTYPGSKTVSFGYDDVGNLTQMVDSLGTTTHAYDANNRRTSTHDPFGNEVSYGYDGNGNRITLGYPGGKVVSYGYDKLNQLAAVTDWLNHKTQYSYDVTGRLTGINNANGTTTSYNYDNANRLTGLANKKADGTVINGYSYTLDEVGNHTQEDRNEPLPPEFTPETVKDTVDEENRLTKSNAVANSFDANGNMTGKGNDTYRYDVENRLVQSNIDGVVTAYQYDGFGNRYSRTQGSTTRYLLDTNTQLTNVLAEMNQAGDVLVYNIYGHGLIGQIKPDNSMSTFHYDSRGSTIAMTNSTESVTSSYAYDPFGLVVNSSGDAANGFRYLGKYGVQYEGDGLNYIRARYYDSGLQRFISKDTYLGEDGNTQTLNRYVYALNNSVIYIDPTGHFAWNVFGESLIERSKLIGVSTLQMTASVGEIVGTLLSVGASGVAALRTPTPTNLAGASVAFMAGYEGVNSASKQTLASLSNLGTAMFGNNASYASDVSFADDFEGKGIIDPMYKKYPVTENIIKTAVAVNYVMDVKDIASNAFVNVNLGAYKFLPEWQKFEFMMSRMNVIEKGLDISECVYYKDCPLADEYKHFSEQIEFSPNNNANHPSILEIEEVTQPVSNLGYKKEYK
ncbi:RHS repeat-associated core domain-containing protein [Thiothrix nivea]|uniref:RHS repeat-associated core domain-containing protein n=1 Tax=Thiothrix nivea (strain ATCC 35100 / DSM 5205 / JP2) TaxID=870187 RepID=A0A656HHZ7_THINJ|nr:RHS repeat-associated core domain-containing protein [Thiothrix nivea]EIJ36558.1 RHS repeat-associated core domain-containing protein [Thiothrix nivea DSM 5205]